VSTSSWWRAKSSTKAGVSPGPIEMLYCASLQRALTDDEIERQQLSKALLPHVRRFCVGYFDPDAHAPYYRPGSRV
jgi:hypothetical protein